jgi:hypothetical protein
MPQPPMLLPLRHPGKLHRISANPLVFSAQNASSNLDSPMLQANSSILDRTIKNSPPCRGLSPGFSSHSASRQTRIYSAAPPL